MEINPENIQVIHNEAEERFEAVIDGKLSKLDYRNDGKVITMTHVGVHPDLRGYGLAGKITQVALEYAKEKNLRVIPMCSYVAAYVRRNPQYMELTKQHAPE